MTVPPARPAPAAGAATSRHQLVSSGGAASWQRCAERPADAVLIIAHGPTSGLCAVQRHRLGRRRCRLPAAVPPGVCPSAPSVGLWEEGGGVKGDLRTRRWDGRGSVMDWSAVGRARAEPG